MRRDPWGLDLPQASGAPARCRTAREAMDRESRQERPGPSYSYSSSSSCSYSSGLEWDQDSSGSFEIRNPPASSRTSPILAWLPNAPRTLHPLISQPPPTTSSRSCPRPPKSQKF